MVGRDFEFSNLLLTPRDTPVNDRSQLRGEGVEKLRVSFGLVDPILLTDWCHLVHALCPFIVQVRGEGVREVTQYWPDHCSAHSAPMTKFLTTEELVTTLCANIYNIDQSHFGYRPYNNRKRKQIFS